MKPNHLGFVIGYILLLILSTAFIAQVPLATVNDESVPPIRPLVVLLPAYLVSNPAFIPLANDDTWLLTATDEFKEYVIYASPDAVVVHKEMAAQLPDDWFMEQLRAGRSIPTIDMDPADVQQLVNLPTNGYEVPPFITSPYLIYRYSRGGSGGSGILSLKDFDDFIQYVQSQS